MAGIRELIVMSANINKYKFIIHNLFFFIAILFLHVVNDYMYVRSGQDHSSIWYSKWVNIPLWAIVPLGFYYLNYRLSRDMEKPNKFIVPIVISIVLSLLWLFIGITVIINMHFLFGGSIWGHNKPLQWMRDSGDFLRRCLFDSLQITINAH